MARGNVQGGYGTAARSVYSHTHMHTRTHQARIRFKPVLPVNFDLYLCPVLISLTAFPHRTSPFWIAPHRNKTQPWCFPSNTPVHFCWWPQPEVEGQHLSSWMFRAGRRSLMSRDNRQPRKRKKQSDGNEGWFIDKVNKEGKIRV